MELKEYCRLIRAKNAGPFTMTIDVMFKDHDAFSVVVNSNLLTDARIASIYHVQRENVRIFIIESALAMKITFDRPVVSGSVMDGDIFGGQFHAPLVELEVAA